MFASLDFKLFFHYNLNTQINSALAGVTEYARLARACCQVQPISGERGEVEEERGEAGRGKEKEEKDS